MPIPVVVGALSLLSGLGAFLLRLVTLEVAKFVAYRALLLSFALVILPAVFENFIVYIYTEVMNIADAEIATANIQNAVLDYSSLAAYLVNTMGIDTAASLIMSALAVRFTLNLIPFIRI